MASQQIPDTLTDQQRAETVYNTLAALQLDELNNQMARLRGGGDGNLPSGSFDGDGNPVSFDDRGKQLAQQQQALVDEYKDLLPLVKEIADERSGA